MNTLPPSTTAIVFDFDGCIADSLSLFHRLYQQTCERFDLHLPVSTLDEFRAWYNARWERNFLDMGVSEENVQEVLDYARAHVDYSSVTLFPEVVSAVRSLAPQYRLGIASTTDASVIEGKLEAEGLRHLFGVVIGGEEGGSDKIARFGDALKGLGAEGRHSVGIGDTPLDVHCSRHWGMRTIGVTYGWNAEHLVAEARPDRLVRHPSEVEAAIRSLLA